MHQSLDSFLFRTPYFPFSALPDFETKQREPVFKEMLQVATADLSESIEKGEDRALLSAYRYFQRACTRPTPFGLFAGCSVGTVGDEIILETAVDFIHELIDMQILISELEPAVTNLQPLNSIISKLKKMKGVDQHIADVLSEIEACLSAIDSQSVSGPSAANFLERFCHLDEQILKHTLDITEKEAQLNPEVIYAEIVHLPESRLGNIQLREKWKTPIDEKIILFAGRMDEAKGLEYLIKSFRRVLSVYPRSRLAIVGEGTFRNYIRESQDICARITYTGFLDKLQLYEWYRIADIGVIPSLFESFGYVAVEMMMHELPIVATETSGLNEVVDESCGLKIPIVKYNNRVEINSEFLAEKILYLLQHPVEAKEIGRNGRKRFLKEYSADIFRNKMLQLYESLF